MTDLDVAGALEAFLREAFSIASDDPDFDRDVHLFDYGYVDSFGAIELVSFIESEFSVRIEATDFLTGSLASVNDFANFVAGNS